MRIKWSFVLFDNICRRYSRSESLNFNKYDVSGV